MTEEQNKNLDAQPSSIAKFYLDSNNSNDQCYDRGPILFKNSLI